MKKKFFIVFLIAILAILVVGCKGSLYARMVCDPRPVDDFNPLTGKVNCSQEKIGLAGDDVAGQDQTEVDSVETKETFDVGTCTPFDPYNRDPLIESESIQFSQCIWGKTIVYTPTPELSISTMSFVPYEPEGGIPYSGSTWNVDVAPDEIEVLTGGPACIAGVCLPGGTNRGFVIILLPDPDVVVSYTVTGLVAGSNWHASYRPLSMPNLENVWRSLAEDRVAAMRLAPNCTDGNGCDIIDVLIVGPNEVVVDQWIVQ